MIVQELYKIIFLLCLAKKEPNISLGNSNLKVKSTPKSNAGLFNTSNSLPNTSASLFNTSTSLPNTSASLPNTSTRPFNTNTRPFNTNTRPFNTNTRPSNSSAGPLNTSPSTFYSKAARIITSTSYKAPVTKKKLKVVYYNR